MLSFVSNTGRTQLEEFDLIVIRSGSGLDVANSVYQHGLKVAFVEKDRMGRTCLNRGCRPAQAADLYC